MSTIPKTYIYQVFNSSNAYLGRLPNVTTPFQYSYDINTAGTTINVTCGVSVDTSWEAVSNLTDESGNLLTDESSVQITTDGQPPIVGLGAGPAALIQNGNRVYVYENSSWHPNGVCVFIGQIQRWEASYGGNGDGSGGAATSDTGAESISLMIYSDGQDLSQYMAYAPDLIEDQSQLTNASGYYDFAGLALVGGQPYPYYSAQTWVAGAGVTNIAAISLLLSTALGNTEVVTVSIYNGTPTTSTTNAPGQFMGKASLTVNASSPTVYQFLFSPVIKIVAGGTYTMVISGADTNGAFVYCDSSQAYGSAYSYNGVMQGSGWEIAEIENIYSDNSASSTPISYYFETFSGTLDTTGTLTSMDPTTGMASYIMSGYNSSGGLIQSGTITPTGLSINYQLQTNTVFQALQAALSLCPPNYYFYVDLGSDTLVFTDPPATAQVVLTKGYHLNQITVIATIENVINTAFFMGGIPSGGTTNVYVTTSNGSSVTAYGPHLAVLSDSNVLDTATASIVAKSDVSENSSEQNQTTVTVLSSQYDLTLFKPGMTVGFNGFGTFVDNLVLQIVRIDYTPEQATLTLGVLPKRLSLVIDQITSGLIGQESIANPSTPTFSV